ncbi:hypothetical protein SAMN04488096_101339 [Mesonia phycicola]|uniref:Sulfotransferase family protein n=1 Tax=Mesonia phycicola TaxID=579105 RepID=A0A1M6AM32_9FLAO|nr:sulfotransferase family protein [Mesonia phycicola]SHI37559.1 hypothetical protein SAMN04488096_101339 [Mesonia phycicola]
MSIYNKHVVVVGSARSGTSWLAETIAQQHRYRLLFEPEQETQTKNGKLLCDKYFTNDYNDVKANYYLKKVFANRVDCDWIAQSSNRKWKRHLWPLIPKKFVIKFVRCNLSAKYMNEHFQIPVIHIIRNPYDVIKSQQRVRFPWLYDLSHFAEQDHLVELVDQHFKFNLKDVSKFNETEILTIRWCLENVIPLQVQESYPYKSTVIKHEDLRADVNVYLKLCSDFNLEPVKNIEKAYKRPSTKAHPKSEVRVSSSGQLKLDQLELTQINTILDRFETTLYRIK